jgi:hypothetical protein
MFLFLYLTNITSSDRLQGINLILYAPVEMEITKYLIIVDFNKDVDIWFSAHDALIWKIDLHKSIFLYNCKKLIRVLQFTVFK